MASQPRMLSGNQIEAHVSRLTSVREGLRKYEVEDGRANDAGIIIEAAIAVLGMEAFSTPDEEPEGSEDVAQNPEDRVPFDEPNEVQSTSGPFSGEDTPETEPDQPRLDHPAY